MRKILIGSVVGVVALATLTVAFLMLGKDKTTGLDVNKVARDNSTQKSQDPGMRPAPGTYRFVGSGTESVSALGGSKHVFPKEIALVIKLKSGCQWTQEWLYAKEHTIKQTMCTDDAGVHQLSSTETVSFFDIKEVEEFTCGDSLAFKAAAKPSERWSWQCKTKETTTESFRSFIGTEKMTFGCGEQTVMHYKGGDTVSGKSEGTTTNEDWVLPSGLTVHSISATDVDSKSVIGDTKFLSNTDYTLQSCKPA